MDDQQEAVEEVLARVGMLLEDASAIALVRSPRAQLPDRISSLERSVDEALVLIRIARESLG